VPDYEGNFYDRADEFWQNLGYNNYEFEPGEQQEVRVAFDRFLFDVSSGWRPEASFAFYEFLDLMGLDEDTFDWDEFREWYDSQ
jgi:hypothetical protein